MHACARAHACVLCEYRCMCERLAEQSVAISLPHKVVAELLRVVVGSKPVSQSVVVISCNCYRYSYILPFNHDINVDSASILMTTNQVSNFT